MDAYMAADVAIDMAADMAFFNFYFFDQMMWLLLMIWRWVSIKCWANFFSRPLNWVIFFGPAHDAKHHFCPAILGRPISATIAFRI